MQDSKRSRVALIRESSGRSTIQSQSLLRSRLQAVAVVLLVGLGLFLFRDLLFYGFFGGEPTRRLFFNILASFVTMIVVGGAFWVLRIKKALSISCLRWIETAIFSLVALLVAADQYFEIRRLVFEGEGGLAVAAIRGFMFIYFLLMVLYGLFIPNSWKQAARIVIPLSLLTPVVNLVLYLQYPEFEAACGEFATFDQTSISIALMLSGAITVLYGAHVMYTLRKQAFEAKRFGQYQLTERIGSGGMGEVWRAKHQMLARPAAIKLIKPEVLGSETDASPSLIRRFEREAQATALLQSHHTVNVHDFGVTDDGIFYYVMELLNGLDLDTLVERHGPLIPGRTLHFLKQVCDSLGEAHVNGLVHRDIKPANIYACRCGIRYDVAKVLDFGLVKEYKMDEKKPTRLTAQGTVTGTPAFMAPEAAMDARKADIRSDLYSVGCVGYWLLTGSTVFEADTPVATIMEHVQTAPIAPSKRSELEIPEELDRIILHCLEKKPEKRPQSAMELLQGLEACPCDTPWTSEQARDWWEKHLPST